MALLTKEERDVLLKAKGLYVREKCDWCHQPIQQAWSYRDRNGEICCQSCHTGGKAVKTTEKKETEESNMPKAKAAKKVAVASGTKVGGVFRPTARVSKLYTAIADGKWHTMDELKREHGAKGLDRDIQKVMRRGKVLGVWKIERGEGELRLIFTAKGKAKVSSAKSNGTAKKATESAEAAEEEGGKAKAETVKAKAETTDDGAGSKGPASKKSPTKSLIRRTLQSGGEWTKNRMLEYLQEEHTVDPKKAEVALAEEVEAGGIKVVKGVLELVV